MASTTASRRYAKGLIQLAVETNRLAAVLSDMQFISETFKAVPELDRILASPVINDEKKKSIIDEVFSGVQSDLTKNLFLVLSEKKRLSLLEGVSNWFIQLYKSQQGILDILVTTAFEMESSQFDALVAAFSKSTGKKIQASIATNPQLIGGITVQYNDTVIDGSVRNKLQRITEIMHV